MTRTLNLVLDYMANTTSSRRVNISKHYMTNNMAIILLLYNITLITETLGTYEIYLFPSSSQPDHPTYMGKRTGLL